MAQPNRPPVIDPGLANIHITSNLPPSTIASGLSAHSEYRLQYIGPVGELQGEYIFQVKTPNNVDVKRSDLQDRPLLKALKGIDGVKGAKVLESKQRPKRDEF